MQRLFALALFAIVLCACATAGPTLTGILGRIDVPTVIRCASMSGAAAKARCLGLEAMSVGVEVALEKAHELAERARDAGNPNAGAADMSEDEKRALARDLDQALAELSDEVAKAS